MDPVRLPVGSPTYTEVEHPLEKIMTIGPKRGVDGADGAAAMKFSSQKARSARPSGTQCAVGTAPGALPLLGHTLPLLRSPLRFLVSLPARGDLVVIRIGPLKAIVVCAPELLREVLLNDRAFDRGGPFSGRGREMFGDGLVTCPYSRHRRQRRLAQPAFHPTRLPGYARVMTRRIAEVTGSWRDGQVLDVLPEMLTLTSGTVVETMSSDALPPAMLGAVLDDFGTVMAGSYKRTLMPPSLDKLPLFGNRRYDRARFRL
jgi:cytochrome P450